MQEFLKDKSPHKRRAKVEELLKRVPADAGEKKTSKAQGENSTIDNLVEQKWRDAMKAWNSQKQYTEKPQPPKPETKSDPQGASLNIPALGPSPVALDFAFPVLGNDQGNKQVFSFYYGIAR
jgi:hypothetical protein